jgi:hypothetical protein
MIGGWATREDGSALVVAIALLAVMLVVGMASYAGVDRVRQRAVDQRERETALNLAEAVLYSQGFVLALGWPGNAVSGAAMPTTCTSAAVVTACPDPRTLAAGNASGAASANFTSVDVAAGVGWTTRVRDNGGPIGDAFILSQADAAQSGTNAKTGAAYTCPSPCKWDANGDLMLWIQARAIVRGQPRNLVGLLKREEFSESVGGGSAVVAGSFETTNSGNKTIIDASGSQVVVRCTSTDDTCTDYKGSKGQVLPPTIVRDAATPPGMTAAQRGRFMAVAQSSSPSTYYTSCPSTLTGRVVYIDVLETTTCSDSNNGDYNTEADPGIVIMPRGKLAMKGSLHGIVYMGNAQNSSGAVLTLEANSEIFGGVIIDGPGRLVAGQASGNRSTVKFMANAFNGLATYGTAGLVQNTWRELPPT